MEIANRETYGLLAVVLLLLIRQYPVDLAIQNFVLRRMRRRRLRLRFLQCLQMLYLFYRTPSPASCSPAKTCLGIPSSSELVPGAFKQQGSRSLVEENFRVSRATFEFICLSAQHHKNMPSMCCGFRIYYFLPPRLVELLLWLDKPLLNPTTWFGKRHG